jgi:uncharacterized protein (TIGR02118 family)
MHRLLVLYPHPDNTEHFRDYYLTTHLPLAAALPGLRGMRHGFDVDGLAEDSPYFAVFEADFDNTAALHAALGSPQGQAVAADVANYASGGARLLHYAVQDGHPQTGSVDARQVLLDYLDNFNRHDPAAIVAMFAEGGTYTDPALNGAKISGDELIKHLEQLFGAVPDLHLRILSAGAEGPDTAVAYWYMSGAATGPNPPSHEGTYNMAGADILCINDHGKIVWTEALYDQKTFVEQGGFA